MQAYPDGYDECHVILDLSLCYCVLRNGNITDLSLCYCVLRNGNITDLSLCHCVLRNGNITDFLTTWPKVPISLWSEEIKLVKIYWHNMKKYEIQKIYWRVGSLRGWSSSVRGAISYWWSTVTHVTVKEGIYQCISDSRAISKNEILLLWKIMYKERLTKSLHSNGKYVFDKYIKCYYHCTTCIEKQDY
jgi:hypothetical protein